MDQQLPEPLNTPDCDIRGFQYMGWYGDIYYASDAYKLALKNGRAGIAAQKLWWEAFAHQVPAGSLPYDDDDLARLADFGTDLRAWRKVKETALHGFILCSDGRLYHKFVVERAKVANKTRIGNRTRQANWHARHQAQVIENTELSPEDNANITRDITRDTPVTSGAHNALVTGESKGKESKGKKESTKGMHSSEPVHTEPARLASLNVVQGPHSSTEPAAEPEPVNDRHLMPRASDPPHRWIGSGLARGPDGKPRTSMHEMEPRLVAGIPGVNRVMVDYAARKVCLASLKQPTWRGDWHYLVGWLDEGFELHKHIIPAIEGFVARRQKSDKGYDQPSTLWCFDAIIREYVAKCRAAEAA